VAAFTDAEPSPAAGPARRRGRAEDQRRREPGREISTAGASYATSPIWSIVDGAWRLKTYNSDGDDVLVPNPKYSGSPRPRLAAVDFQTYTSPAAEYSALRTGQLDIGIVPAADLPPKPASGALPGYGLDLSYSFYFYRVNFNNPAFGAVFKQLYVRQALEYLADQTTMAQTIYRGYGYPTTGPAPAEPANQWVPPIESGAGPYPFSIAKARTLLTSHGWTKAGGVMTCTDPAKCGAGIAKGTPLKFTLDYATDVAEFPQEAEVYKSDAAQAGVDINAVGETFNAIISTAVPDPTGLAWNLNPLTWSGFGVAMIEGEDSALIYEITEPAGITYGQLLTAADYLASAGGIARSTWDMLSACYGVTEGSCPGGVGGVVLSMSTAGAISAGQLEGLAEWAVGGAASLADLAYERLKEWWAGEPRC